MKHDPPPLHQRRHHLRVFLELLLPVLFLALVALGLSQRLLPERWLSEGQHEAAASDLKQDPVEMQGRLVIVILDSLRPEAMRDHMPRLNALANAGHTHTLPVKTCHANITIACVQTIFAGQESPFASGLHNFTGTQKSPVSMPHIFHQAGLTQYFISDYTLESLYSGMARESINVEKWQGSWLEHDLESIALADSWLEPGSGHDPDVLVLHVIGTDKIAHRLNPGNVEYAEHFARVDEALEPLLQKIDPERDHLLVMGDHGHDLKGFHDQDSLVILESPILTPLFATHLPEVDFLHQYELAYLFALVTHTAPPTAYEGRHFGLLPERVNVPALDSFEPALRRSLAKELKLAPSTSTGELIQAQQERLERGPREALMRVIPLLMVYMLWLLGLFLPSCEGGSPDAMFARPWKRRLLSMTALFWLLHYTGLLIPAWAALALTVIPLVMLVRLLSEPMRADGEHLRLVLGIMTASLVMIAALSPLNDRWRDLMHATQGSTWASPIFFVTLITIAMVLSRLLARHFVRELPLILGALCFFGLPGGVYYYQFGQNITRSFILGGAIYTVYLLVKKRQRLFQSIATPDSKFALGLFALGVGSLLWQHSGGWHWYSSLEMWIRLKPIWVSLAFYVVMSGLLTTLIWRAAHWKHALHVALWLVAGGVYSVWIGELTWPRADSTLMVLVALAAWLNLTQNDHTPHRDHTPLLHPVFLAALLVMLFWTVFRGFEIDHIDFNFTFKYMTGLHREFEIALVSTAMTHSKYAIFLAAALAVLVALRPAKWPWLMAGVMGVLHFKVICLLIQTSAGPLGGKEKLYELATIDLAFMLGLMLWLMLLSACMLPLASRPQREPAPPREQV